MWLNGMCATQVRQIKLFIIMQSVRVVTRVLGVTRHHPGIARTTRALSALPSGSGSVPPVTRSERNAAASGGAVDNGGSADSATAAATERAVGSPERLTFQAETKQLLNIVANSLYTDKHVFIRCVLLRGSGSLSLPERRAMASDWAV